MLQRVIFKTHYSRLLFTRMNLTTFKDRERASENAYVNKHEAELLENMITKLENEDYFSNDRKILESILGDTKSLSLDVINKLIDWKYDDNSNKTSKIWNYNKTK